jgi:outer membrane receptor protein involved in Fe transport
MRPTTLLLLATVPLFAQPTASIVGAIRDSSDASVPNAKITVRNTKTSLTVERESAADGSFSVLYLPVGSYAIEVQRPGFQRYLRDGITLAVNDRITLDVTLQVGATTESVTVTGTAPLLEAQTGALRGVVDQQRIVNLPLNGRNMTQLVSLQAGAIQTADSSAGGEGIAFAVNGSRANGVYFLLDGGYNTSTYRNWSGTFPNPDAVQEFSVQRSNFSAEYANATGAVINVVTKAGTNEFHGSAFEFVRNASLNARNFFAPRRDTLKRNQFGGVIGGPVRRDKLFFLYSYQETRLRSDPQLTRQFLPTAAQRRGDFGATRVTDPLTRQPFPNNQIPLTRFSSVTQNFLKFIATPPTPNGERFTGAPNITDTGEHTARIDWNLARHRLSGKFFRQGLSRPLFGDANDIATPFNRQETQPYWHVSGNDIFTISPTMINNATFAWRYRARFSNWGSFRYPIDFKSAGVKGIAVNNPPGFVMNINGFVNIGPSWPYEIEDGDHHFSDTLTWIKGKHELKIGGEFIRSTNAIRNHFRTMGLFTFDGSISGNSMADYLLGEVYNFQQGGGEYKDMRGYRYGLFLQDDWRITPTLTLNLGLRWDPVLPFTDSIGRVQCVRPGLQSTRFPKAPSGYLSAGDPGCPEGGFDAYRRSFAPRFGFAWRTPWHKTVVRGGVGMFRTPLFTVLYNGFVNGAPFSPQINRFAVKFEDPYEGTPNPFPASFAPFTPSRDAGFVLPLGLVGTFDPKFRNSYFETFNFTVERELPHNLLARVSYVGNLGRSLPYSNDINYARFGPGATTRNIQDRRPFPNFGQVLAAIPGANSAYHALQTSFERRFAALAFEANYTWSKSIDDYSSDPTPGQSASLSNPTSRVFNRGLSDFDIRHRAVVSTVWALPLLKDKTPLVRHVLGSWELSGIMTLQSGRPFGVLSGRDNAISGISRDYADLLGNPFLPAGRARAEYIAQYFNPAAYGPNAMGTFGNAPRNHLTGPGLFGLDAAIMKDIPFRERFRAQFRTELFNAVNRPNFSSPFSSQNNLARFGRIEAAGDARVIQLGLKLLF